MKPYVYCAVKQRGILNFYLTVDGEDYFLFSQPFRIGVREYFENGVPLSMIRRYDLARYDTALRHTMDKLPMYIQYVEKEYEIAVLDKTIKKMADRHLAA